MAVFSKLPIPSPFPEEIIEKIIKALDQQKNVNSEDIKNCVLVSQQFYRIAYPIVFKSISVMGPSDRLEPFLELLEALEEGRLKGEVVTSMTLRGVKEEFKHQVALYQRLSTCMLLQILQYTPNLKVVKLYGIKLCSCGHEDFHPIISLPEHMSAVIFDRVLLRSYHTRLNQLQHYHLFDILQPQQLCMIYTVTFPSMAGFSKLRFRQPKFHMKYVDPFSLHALQDVYNVEDLQLWDVDTLHQTNVASILRGSQDTLRKIVIGAHLGMAELEDLEDWEDIGLKNCINLVEATFAVLVEDNMPSELRDISWQHLLSLVCQLPSSTSYLRIVFYAPHVRGFGIRNYLINHTWSDFKEVLDAVGLGDTVTVEFNITGATCEKWEDRSYQIGREESRSLQAVVQEDNISAERIRFTYNSQQGEIDFPF